MNSGSRSGSGNPANPGPRRSRCRTASLSGPACRFRSGSGSTRRLAGAGSGSQAAGIPAGPAQRGHKGFPFCNAPLTAETRPGGPFPSCHAVYQDVSPWSMRGSGWGRYRMTKTPSAVKAEPSGPHDDHRASLKISTFAVFGLLTSAPWTGNRVRVGTKVSSGCSTGRPHRRFPRQDRPRPHLDVTRH
jgi:hypothetical protein